MIKPYSPFHNPAEWPGWQHAGSEDPEAEDDAELLADFLQLLEQRAQKVNWGVLAKVGVA